MARIAYLSSSDISPSEGLRWQMLAIGVDSVMPQA